MDWLVRYTETFAKEILLSFLRLPKKIISPSLDINDEVCGPCYYWQPSWHGVGNWPHDKLSLWKAEWREIRSWCLYQLDQASPETLLLTFLLFEPTDFLYCLSQFNFGFLWFAAQNIRTPTAITVLQLTFFFNTITMNILHVVQPYAASFKTIAWFSILGRYHHLFN